MSSALFAFWLDVFGGFIAVGLLAIGYAWFTRRAHARAVPPPPDPFSAPHITHTFIAALPRLCPELNLEVATSRTVEFWERTDQRWFLGLSLGTNVAQLRAPVTYRYHLRLADPWRLVVQRQSLIVHAPPLRAALPPALHTDQMETRTERGWARGSPEELLRQLQREVTPQLCQWAENADHLGLVRETARQQTAEFVRRWLAGESRWGPRSFTTITVCFPGETPPSLTLTRSLFLTSNS
jgi:hypothetical protein